MRIQEFHKGMREYFKIQNPENYLNKHPSDIGGVIKSLDIGRFDDWLHDRVGPYEMRGLNMGEVLSINYGTSASLFIKSLL
ncbi:unnamed protein product [marine sediment metagenome]|uniref:Uncharacterized protein n=1 Tax=marine sediment metagenome TaxID=412755 RepID=X0VVY1_9ZZZZ